MCRIKNFDKFKRPIDYLKDDPFLAIREVWLPNSLDYLRAELEYMFYMAVSAEITAYEDQDQRAPFVEFYYELLYFVEAMYFLNLLHDKKRQEWYNKLTKKERKQKARLNKPIKLSHDKVANPMLIIKPFCECYSLEYCQIELGHFMEAVIAYKGSFTEEIFIANIITFYEDLKCLCEAAHIISKK